MSFLNTVRVVQFNEIFPLWVLLPVEQGGLGFETQQIGIVIGINGLVLVVWQLWIFHRIIQKYALDRVLVYAGFRLNHPADHTRVIHTNAPPRAAQRSGG